MASVSGNKRQATDEKSKKGKSKPLKIDDKRMKEIRRSFELFDRDNNGRITQKEIGEVMKSMGQNPSESELRTIMKQADRKRRGSLNLQDFADLVTQKYEEIDTEEEEIRNAFKVFDRNGNGSINVSDIRRVLAAIGTKMTKDEIDDVIREADLNDDGVIDYEEFSRVLAFKFI